MYLVGAWSFFVPREATVLPTATRYFVGTAAAVGRYFKSEGRTFFGPGASPAFSGNDDAADRW